MRRRRARRAAVPGVVAVTLLGLLSPVAVAAPALPAAPAKQAATPTAEVPPVSSEPEKVRAARTLGVVPTDAMMALRDKDFVIALWRTATGPEVRASAELAFTSSDLACTEWIKSGVLAANTRDQENKMRDAEAAKVAKEAKEKVLLLLGIVDDAELTVQNNKDFIIAVLNRAQGPKVRAAAVTALGASAAAQKEFIASGIRLAYAADQRDIIEANAQADAEKKARLLAEAARGNAVTVVRVTPTPEIKSLPDDDVLRVIADNARPGSQIETAAVKALRSRDRADWKRFIDTGVYEANDRDIDAVLAQKAQADRALVEEMRTKAVRGGIQPRLAIAAAKALAGGVDAVSGFLETGQYQALTQSFSRQAINGNTAGHYLRESADGVLVSPGAAEPGPEDGVSATWRVVPGLAGQDCHSLESVTRPNHYLARFFDGKKVQVKVMPTNGTVDFDWNATWCADNILPGAGVTLRSGADFLTRTPDGRAGMGSEYYWWVMDPNPDSTEITLDWLNRELPDYDPYTELMVYPVREEQVDGSVRFRDFQSRGTPPRWTFRSYWSRATGVHRLYVGKLGGCPAPELLDTYVRLGGHRTFGVPVTDDSCAPDKLGRFAHFANNVSIYSVERAGVHAVQGAIRSKWQSLGAEKSTLGYPTSDEFDIPGGRRSTFEHGRIDYDFATKTATVYPTGN
ncbi:AbfB domain-containing protein [Amycolatopsis samaneae]|uniref:AbfB domain-containing protein n=1 Tax=Amycolatopsis samaneae TaxID=664691 RepID=A0ABW5G7Z9_9PSEU